MSHKVAIIQARMDSSRLPGKVMLDIAGQPMIVRVIERVNRAKSIDQVVLATTDNPSDDAIEQLCKQRGYHCFRGSQFNVLDRYYQAARIYNADVIVRITGDCPMIDPTIIDQVIHALLEGQVDFATNRLPPPWKRTYPIGLDTEVCTFEALERTWNEAVLSEDIEHVMPYMYSEAGRFKIIILNNEVDYGHYRWTVDTQKDLELVRQVYAHFEGKDDFGWLDVINLYKHHPDLRSLNADVVHKTVRDVDKRLNTHQKK
jgi:spore coat polysaccharide biosynthesis protein SpsF